MGKLATTGRLVTRDNEEEEALVWLLERSGASSGRALVAVPIGGITIRGAIVPEVGSGASIEAAVIGGNASTNIVSNRFEKEACQRIAVVGIRETRSRGLPDDRKSRYFVETAIGDADRGCGCGCGCGRGCGCGSGDAVVCLADSSFASPLDRQRWFGDVVENGNNREYRPQISSEWRQLLREGPIERRTIVEARKRSRYHRRWYLRYLLAGRNELSLLFGIVTIVAVAAVLCVPATSAVPMLSVENPLSLTGIRYDLDHSTGLEDVYEDAFENAFREEDGPTTRTVLGETELDIIRKSIARGLGLERIPDSSKANISQAEYERAHREYLKRMQLSFGEQISDTKKKLHVFSATAYPGNESSQLFQTSERETYNRHWLYFPVEIPDEHGDALVDHATLRLLLHGPITDDYTERSELDVLLYLRTVDRSKKLIGQRRIKLQDSRNSRWLEFDATLAASWWLEAAFENLGLELQFLLDGEPVQRTFSSPVFNVFTATPSETSIARTKRSSPEELMSLHKGRRTKCKGESKKCCRHELTVMFKDLKGFEFIVYPKTFDAGYCKGRCPPRYNPAHHHALLQSLLWKEDRKKVPKPCCAPSKLDQLMIVYFDENDSTQLKVSYWKNIQVLECACS